MNRSSVVSRSCRVSGFTLVELLVVIAIIAILAGAVLGIAGNVIKQAKKAKAANTATQIQTACLAYYTEYSVYPVAVSGATTASAAFISDSDATHWGYLTQSLSGNIAPHNGVATTPAVPANTRSIAFLSLKASDVDSKDGPLNPLPPNTTQLYFNLATDAEYCGVIGVTPSSLTTLPNFSATTWNAAAQAGGGTTTAGIAVWANCNASATLNAASNWVHTY